MDDTRFFDKKAVDATLVISLTDALIKTKYGRGNR